MEFSLRTQKYREQYNKSLTPIVIVVPACAVCTNLSPQTSFGYFEAKPKNPIRSTFSMDSNR